VTGRRWLARGVLGFMVLLVLAALATTTSSDAAPAGHEQHGVDPVGAALLVLDGAVLLTVVGLLLRRPRGR
jgi:hypothetical protein